MKSENSLKKRPRATREIVKSIGEMRVEVDDSVALVKGESESVDKVVGIVNDSMASIDRIVEDMETRFARFPRF